VIAALDSIMQVRAVQDFTPAALEFLFTSHPARPAAGSGAGTSRCPHRRDAPGFDLYMKCRERLCEARVNETKRRVYAPSNGRSSQSTPWRVRVRRRTRHTRSAW
jgi:hypothetical protein